MRWLMIPLFVVATSLFMVSATVSAQQSSAEIGAGLCSGANLTITDNPTNNCNGAGDDSTTKLNNLVQQAVNLLSAAVGIVAVIMIIVGGLRYITSGGNDSSVTGAKNTILYAVIGLIVVALAQLIVRFTLDKVSNS